MTASLDYRSLFAALPSAHVVLEPRPPYRILDVNDAYAHASLRPREALVGHGLFEAFPDRPDEPEGAGSARLRQSFELAVATRGPHALPAQRYDIPSPGGGFKTRWWRATTIPVLDAAGTVTHLLHCSEDVTALMTAQAGRAAAEESEARLRALFEQAAAGILVVDLAGRFVTVNDRFCTLVGRSREELLGLSSLDVTHPDDVAASLDVYRRIAAGGGSVSLEKRYLRPDGTAVWASLSASPARGPDGRIVHVVGVVHEVTELHRTAAALRERESKYRSLFESIDEGFCVVQMIFDDA
ncbi:MAG TPA: PAS domain S-box protein, partial [Gemmatimonadales bacterium]|nr:PAS domain S-box protein [Gemmatimonadales bacterium]